MNLDFYCKLLQCAELIRTMGLPVFELDGEAEAVCAVLNRDEVNFSIYNFVQSFGFDYLECRRCNHR